MAGARAFRSELLATLSARGYLHQLTDAEGLDALACAGPVVGYIGFDPTASSLHVGHLVSIMLLRRLQEAGGVPIVLLGGGTGRIGDPSGKDEARRMLPDATIAANVASIRATFARFLDLERAVVVDNADWLNALEYISFLRGVGTHFSLSRMLSMDSVRLRLEREQPLSFLEFNYMILQAYDFLELHRRHACRLQMGGSDQWGNIVAGVDLVRRVDGEAVFGLTTPLVLNADSSKMGKSVGGAVWLDSRLLPTDDYRRFWLETRDADIGARLRLFTDLPSGEIDRIVALRGREADDARRALADAATTLCRGTEHG